MEDNEQVKMFAELPQTDEPKEKERSKHNCFQEIVLELMNERGLRDADVIRATGLKWPTWHGWISGEVNTQLTGDELYKAWRFFNVPLHYLIYGIGDPTPVFEEFEEYKPDEKLIK